MENLPFLTKNESQSRNERAPSESEWHPAPPQQMYEPPAPSKVDALETLKANPMGLILIGIIIGVLIANMRPVIIQPK
jgi:hypothetical protein